jgi:DNA-binding MarR family transcriptional regulator
VLAVHGPLPAGTLAQFLGVQPAAVTGLSLRLERLGYLERERDARDRRRVWVKPTGEAQRVVSRAIEIVRPRIAEVFAPGGRGPALALATLLSSVVGPWLAERLPVGPAPGTTAEPA